MDEIDAIFGGAIPSTSSILNGTPNHTQHLQLGRHP